MYSFYGGRPGNSFSIITTFPSVADMISAFGGGPAYTDVHYDEYVMINTPNKNNPENGRIYRRGYNYNNNIGGAEYIGTIAGPSGNAPDLYLTTYNSVKNKSESYSYKTGQLSVGNENLIPGRESKTVNNKEVITYNDKILWASGFKKDTNSENTKAYIGLKIPYMEFDINAKTVEPNTPASVTQILDKQPNSNQVIHHPFYKNLLFQIPRGQKGDSFDNLRVMTVTEDNSDSIEYDNADKKEDDASHARKIIAYDIHDFNNENNVEAVKTRYLGDYNMINSLSLDENGLLQADYTHDGKVIINNGHPIKWIKNIAIDSQNQNNLKVTYNTKDNNGNDISEIINFDYISSVYYNQSNRTITFYDNHGKQSTVPVNFKTIENITQDENQLTIRYNTGDSDNFTIRNITDARLTSKGELQVFYNNNTNDPQTINSDNPIRWIESIQNDPDDMNKFQVNYNIGNSSQFSLNGIKNIQLNSQGKLYVTYNNNSIPQQLTTDNNRLRWITNASLNNSGNFSITWNGEDQPQSLGIINSIKDLKINNNNQVLAKFATTPTGKTADADGYVNIGTIIPRAEYSVGGTVEDLSWSGIGQISDNGTANTRIVTFSLPVIGCFAPNVQRIGFKADSPNGDITINDGNNNIVIAMDSETTIEKTFTGLNFTVTFKGGDAASFKTSGFVNLAISNMNLQFYEN